MRASTAVAVLTLAATLSPATASADPIIYANGVISGSTAARDSGPVGGVTWTIYDDFRLTTAATVTGFTVGEIITHGGSPSDYVGTNWSLWATDPLTDGAQPLASGLAVATLVRRDVQDGLLPEWFFSVTGLNVALSANVTYWLGAGHLFVADTTGDVRFQASSVRLRGFGNLPGFRQASSSGIESNWAQDDTYFTISGTEAAPAPTPEPASLLLVGGALAGMLRTVRRRGAR